MAHVLFTFGRAKERYVFSFLFVLAARVIEVCNLWECARSLIGTMADTSGSRVVLALPRLGERNVASMANSFSSCFT